MVLVSATPACISQVYAPSIDEMASRFPENRQYFCQYVNTQPHTINNIANTDEVRGGAIYEYSGWPPEGKRQVGILCFLFYYNLFILLVYAVGKSWSYARVRPNKTKVNELGK